MGNEHAQTMLTIEKALKEYYLPAFVKMFNVEPSALMQKIKQIPLEANKIVSAAQSGMSGGFGYGEEGKATPLAGNVMFERFEEFAKDMYVNIAISAKTVKLASNNVGSMVDALSTEVQSAYDAAKWNIGRSLFGNGSGKLATTSALSSAGNTITVDDVSKLRVGLLIDIYTTSGTKNASSPFRILSINKANKTITVNGSAQSFAAGFITVQNSYNNEITGLGAIFDDNITTLYGVSKTANPSIKPVVVDAGKDLTDTVIIQALRESQSDRNGDIDFIMCGHGAFDTYREYLRTNDNYRMESSNNSLKGGFSSIKFKFGNKDIDVVDEQFVPDDEIWAVDTKTLELHTTGWNFADLQGGGIFNLMENSSIYRALLTNYGNLICKAPGACVRIKNCKPAT